MIQGLKVIAIGRLGLAVVCVIALWAFQRFVIYLFSSAPQTPADLRLDTVEVVAFTSEDSHPGCAWVARDARTAQDS